MPQISDSGIREIFTLGIRNLGKFCSWNPESWALESEYSSTESEIPLKIGIRNPESGIQVSLTKTGIQYLKSGIHGLDWAKRLTIAFNLNFSRLLEWKNFRERRLLSRVFASSETQGQLVGSIKCSW